MVFQVFFFYVFSVVLRVLSVDVLCFLGGFEGFENVLKCFFLIVFDIS